MWYQQIYSSPFTHGSSESSGNKTSAEKHNTLPLVGFKLQTLNLQPSDRELAPNYLVTILFSVTYKMENITVVLWTTNTKTGISSPQCISITKPLQYLDLKQYLIRKYQGTNGSRAPWSKPSVDPSTPQILNQKSFRKAWICNKMLQNK